jgi:hypothetical protein
LVFLGFQAVLPGLKAIGLTHNLPRKSRNFYWLSNIEFGSIGAAGKTIIRGGEIYIIQGVAARGE